MTTNPNRFCKLRIISAGDGMSTIVTSCGVPLAGVERVEISPIVPGKEVQAIIKVSGVELGDYAGEIRKVEASGKFGISNAPSDAVPMEVLNARTP